MTTNRGFWRIDPASDTRRAGARDVTAGRKSSTVGTFLEMLVTGPGEAARLGAPRHQGPAAALPGLITSDDGGASWTVISRLGEADLHKIVLKHDRMYAFDAVLGAMLDLDRRRPHVHRAFTPREVMLDFEVDPSDPDRIFGSTEGELYRPRTAARAGARSTAGTASGSCGRRPTRSSGPTGTGPCTAHATAACAGSRSGPCRASRTSSRRSSTEHLLLALSDGTIVETKDGGGTWTEVFHP